LLVDLSYKLALHGGRLFLLGCVNHELVDLLLVFGEFPALLLRRFTTFLVVGVPNFSALVFVAKAFVVNNEVVVAALVLPTVVFVRVDIFKNTLGVSDLKVGVRNCGAKEDNRVVV
jgi:hypothetical protein